LSYSNLIASSSNILYTTFSTCLGDSNALKKLDVGGIIVTVYRLINDYQFIQEIKEEFVFGGFRQKIAGDIYNF